jgi:hypothetical protein
LLFLVRIVRITRNPINAFLIPPCLSLTCTQLKASCQVSFATIRDK